jgi:hypothetical protein
LAPPGFLYNDLVGVPAPTLRVYRLTRLGIDPFEAAPWEYVGSDRFDDPDHAYRVIYCASERAGAFGETLARFRRSMPLLDLMAEVDDVETLDEALEGLIDPADTQRGIVPADWRFKRQLGVTLLGPSLQFAEIAAAESIDHLRTALAPIASKNGLRDVDISTVLGSDRELTQHCSRYIYDQLQNGGRPRFAGIRYPSRLNLDWICWAVFSDRIAHFPQFHETTISVQDPGLLEAARVLSLSIEMVRGRADYINP